jgi:hypothetical protein
MFSGDNHMTRRMTTTRDIHKTRKTMRTTRDIRTMRRTRTTRDIHKTRTTSWMNRIRNRPTRTNCHCNSPIL